MTFVDVGIILVTLLAAAHGITQGAAMQVLSFGGFWLGMLVGAALAPVFSRLVSSPFATAFVSLLLFLGFAVIGGAIGRYLGTHAWGALRRRRLGGADAAGGAVVAVVAALAAVWLIAITLLQGPTIGVSRAVNRSAIVRGLVHVLPSSPSVFARLRSFVNTTPFPRVFEGIEPIPAGPIGLPNASAVNAAAAQALRSTVRVQGVGCGGIQTGSGFIVSPGYVVTNAHVVAGIPQVSVDDEQGEHAAQPVLFDPGLDLAVLRTPVLQGSPLALLRSDVKRGQGGAVLGFPGGGTFRAGAAAVLREFNAVGRDIYGREITRRNVYQLQASVHQGNSGGPFVREDGQVIGVIFAASTTDQNIGYALTSTEVQTRLSQMGAATEPVATGPCA